MVPPNNSYRLAKSVFLLLITCLLGFELKAQMSGIQVVNGSLFAYEKFKDDSVHLICYLNPREEYHYYFNKNSYQTRGSYEIKKVVHGDTISHEFYVKGNLMTDRMNWKNGVCCQVKFHNSNEDSIRWERTSLYNHNKRNTFLLKNELLNDGKGNFIRTGRFKKYSKRTGSLVMEGRTSLSDGTKIWLEYYGDGTIKDSSLRKKHRVLSYHKYYENGTLKEVFKKEKYRIVEQKKYNSYGVLIYSDTSFYDDDSIVHQNQWTLSKYSGTYSPIYLKRTVKVNNGRVQFISTEEDKNGYIISKWQTVGRKKHGLQIYQSTEGAELEMYNHGNLLWEKYLVYDIDMPYPILDEFDSILRLKKPPTDYFYNGRRRIKYNKDSSYRKYMYSNGRVRAKGHYNGYLKVGEWKYYYPNGRLQYKDIYNDKGQRLEHVQNKYKPNTKITFHFNGRKKEIKKHNLRGTHYKSINKYYSNGQLKSIYQYKHSKIKKRKYYYPDGTKVSDVHPEILGEEAYYYSSFNEDAQSFEEEINCKDSSKSIKYNYAGDTLSYYYFDKKNYLEKAYYKTAKNYKHRTLKIQTRKIDSTDNVGGIDFPSDQFRIKKTWNGDGKISEYYMFDVEKPKIKYYLTLPDNYSYNGSEGITHYKLSYKKVAPKNYDNKLDYLISSEKIKSTPSNYPYYYPRIYKLENQANPNYRYELKKHMDGRVDTLVYNSSNYSISIASSFPEKLNRKPRKEWIFQIEHERDSVIILNENILITGTYIDKVPDGWWNTYDLKNKNKLVKRVWFEDGNPKKLVQISSVGKPMKTFYIVNKNGAIIYPDRMKIGKVKLQ